MIETENFKVEHKDRIPGKEKAGVQGKVVTSRMLN